MVLGERPNENQCFGQLQRSFLPKIFLKNPFFFFFFFKEAKEAVSEEEEAPKFSKGIKFNATIRRNTLVMIGKSFSTTDYEETKHFNT